MGIEKAVETKRYIDWIEEKNEEGERKTPALKGKTYHKGVVCSQCKYCNLRLDKYNVDGDYFCYHPDKRPTEKKNFVTGEITYNRELKGQYSLVYETSHCLCSAENPYGECTFYEEKT